MLMVAWQGRRVAVIIGQGWVVGGWMGSGHQGRVEECGVGREARSCKPVQGARTMHEVRL